MPIAGDPLEPLAGAEHHGGWFSTAQYFDIKTGHSGFEEIAIALGSQLNLTGDDEPERVNVMRVSSNLPAGC
jgi:hypothetical protein